MEHLISAHPLPEGQLGHAPRAGQAGRRQPVLGAGGFGTRLGVLLWVCLLQPFPFSFFTPTRRPALHACKMQIPTDVFACLKKAHSAAACQGGRKRLQQSPAPSAHRLSPGPRAPGDNGRLEVTPIAAQRARAALQHPRPAPCLQRLDPD